MSPRIAVPSALDPKGLAPCASTVPHTHPWAFSPRLGSWVLNHLISHIIGQHPSAVPSNSHPDAKCFPFLVPRPAPSPPYPCLPASECHRGSQLVLLTHSHPLCSQPVTFMIKDKVASLWWLSGKESLPAGRDMGSIPHLGKIPLALDQLSP